MNLHEFEAKELRRRAKQSPQDIATGCCSSYRLPNGGWQADRDIIACEAMARLLGTFEVRDAITPEQYLSGSPKPSRHISPCPIGLPE